MEQKIITSENNYQALEEWIEENKIKKIFLVCDASFQFLEIRICFEALSHQIGIVKFDDFQPNPLYESVVKGVECFRNKGCDAIIAVGGGSAIDVAKCIKLYQNMNSCGNYLKQTIIPNEIPFLVMPTTAGTGSEATKYAVIYYQGEKQSVTDESCIPKTVLMDNSALKTLPIYQKKSTMLDAFCHGIESYWSINSTDESRKYSRKAIELIMANMEGYFANNVQAGRNMLIAANAAGKAINITQTTAGHAMCYKITSLYGLAHGHAAMLCVRKLFPWMIKHIDRCIDSRGKEYLADVFDQIAKAMGCESPETAADKLESIFASLELSVPCAEEDEYKLLNLSVNSIRLKNHPIALDMETIDKLYHQILAHK